jgi:hypothetical protein
VTEIPEPSGITGPATIFPKDLVGFLRDVLDPPQVTGGPPFTHTFRNPPDEYDDDGNVLPKPVLPSLTVTREPRRPTWLGGTDA